MIQAVIWDLGGVLVRTEDGSLRQELAGRFGVTRQELEDLVFNSASGRQAQLGQIHAARHWQNLGELFGLDQQGREEFQRQFWAGDRVDEELVDYIRSLRLRYKTALLSNAFSDLRSVITSVWRFDDIFEQMVISAEVGMMKPEERIYQLVLDQLGVLPDVAIFIDDFIENVVGARQAGLQAIHFRNTQQLRLELDKALNGD